MGVVAVSELLNGVNPNTQTYSCFLASMQRKLKQIGQKKLWPGA